MWVVTYKYYFLKNGSRHSKSFSFKQFAVDVMLVFQNICVSKNKQKIIVQKRLYG